MAICFTICAIPPECARSASTSPRAIYTQPVHQQQQFGGSVGGPVIKDKLFYFFTYDGSRKINPISFTSTPKFPVACTSSATDSGGAVRGRE